MMAMGCFSTAAYKRTFILADGSEWKELCSGYLRRIEVWMDDNRPWYDTGEVLVITAPAPRRGGTNLYVRGGGRPSAQYACSFGTGLDRHTSHVEVPGFSWIQPVSDAYKTCYRG